MAARRTATWPLSSALLVLLVIQGGAGAARSLGGCARRSAILRPARPHAHAPRRAAGGVEPPAGSADDRAPAGVDDMLAREFQLVLDTLKARGGAADLSLTDADFDALRVRGERLLSELGADIDASFVNASAVLQERIAARMAEERESVLDNFDGKTADVRRELAEGRAQVRESLDRLAALEAKVEPPRQDIGRRAARAVATVAVLLGVYNGGVSLWQGLVFDGARDADLAVAGLELGAAAVGALALWRLSDPEPQPPAR
ncbi:hypothetical protein KFE25_011893 [Diacronema lutheri]|uniref:Uncharacterized protein n=2 Tax=Diacronema lutheri TaxID=2081491 RepID=A0A8J6C332_DIALT|nr:hypothetical protein KFE25_011893 [Diacronema lutheri]